MSEAVYERYKEALRRGHVATMRERFDAALVAYGDAAAIAPERALPHVSIGTTLRRLGRDEEALVAFGLALERSPRDAAALAGRAEALGALGRQLEAANAFDLLAELQEAAGRVADACDTARRALELVESRERRRQVERLARILRDSPPDETSAAALERALPMLERVAPAPVDEPELVESAAPPAPVDPAVAVAQAEASLDAGDDAAARDLLIRAAYAQREIGHVDAAIDACYLALAVAPADPELHVVLAELYLERGWVAPAAEKLLLLGRLVELTGDAAGRERLCAVVASRLPNDPRLRALCA